MDNSCEITHIKLVSKTKEKRQHLMHIDYRLQTYNFLPCSRTTEVFCANEYYGNLNVDQTLINVKIKANN
jgi:hypothetical protein